MNSSTGIPLSTCTFLKSSSAICGFGSGPRWPLDIVVPNKHTITIPIKQRIVRLGFFVFMFCLLTSVVYQRRSIRRQSLNAQFLAARKQ
jgi:hypothetical protein